MKTLINFNSDEDKEKFIILSVLAGQLIRFNSKINILINSLWVDDISNNYDKVIHISDIKEVLKLCLDSIEGYNIFSSEKEFYTKINNLIRDERFLLLIPQNCLSEFLPIINSIDYTDFKPTLEFNKNAFVNIKYSRKNYPIDLAIVNTLYIGFTNFFIKPKHIQKPFIVYGWAGDWIINFNSKTKLTIPLEGVYVAKMTRYGGSILPYDLNHNFATYFKNNNTVKITNLPSEIPEIIKPETKHLISLVISDGDNMGMINSHIKREMGYDRDFPVNWTLNPSMPKIFIDYMFSHNNNNDGFIVSPSGSAYQFVSEIKDKETYWKQLLEQMNEFGLSIINQISISRTGLFSLLGSYFFNLAICNNIPKHLPNKNIKILAYDYFDYSKGNGKFNFNDNDSLVLTPGPLRLYFQKDKKKFENFVWPDDKSLKIIISVNFNGYKIPKLKEIMGSLPKNVQIVNIHTLIKSITK